MRPVDNGYCVYTDLLDGSVDLCDIAEMNEALDVRDENRRRSQKYAEDKRNRR